LIVGDVVVDPLDRDLRRHSGNDDAEDAVAVFALRLRRFDDLPELPLQFLLDIGPEFVQGQVPARLEFGQFGDVALGDQVASVHQPEDAQVVPVDHRAPAAVVDQPEIRMVGLKRQQIHRGSVGAARDRQLAVGQRGRGGAGLHRHPQAGRHFETRFRVADGPFLAETDREPSHQPLIQMEIGLAVQLDLCRDTAAGTVHPAAEFDQCHPVGDAGQTSGYIALSHQIPAKQPGQPAFVRLPSVARRNRFGGQQGVDQQAASLDIDQVQILAGKRLARTKQQRLVVFRQGHDQSAIRGERTIDHPFAGFDLGQGFLVLANGLPLPRFGGGDQYPLVVDQSALDLQR
jgi:hypothetical protein